MKITGCCLPYGESKYHDAVQVGAFAHQDGMKVPLVRDFCAKDKPENVIGHCILHDTDEGILIQVEVTNGCILKDILSLLNTPKDGDTDD